MTDAAIHPARLPDELVVDLETATFVWRDGSGRGEYGEDIEDRAYVMLTGVGSAAMDSQEQLADRIGRAWPELPRQCHLKAARMLFARLGHDSRMTNQPGRSRGGWMNRY